jgi:hypothetical protein
MLYSQRKRNELKKKIQETRRLATWQTLIIVLTDYSWLTTLEIATTARRNMS